MVFSPLLDAEDVVCSIVCLSVRTVVLLSLHTLADFCKMHYS